MPLEEGLIKQILKRRGKSEEEANEIIKLMNAGDERGNKFREYIDSLKLSFETMKELPKGAQAEFAPLVASQFASMNAPEGTYPSGGYGYGGGRSRNDEFMERMSMIKEAFGGDSKQLEAMQKKLEEMERQQREQVFKDYQDRMEEKIKNMENTLNTFKSGGSISNESANSALQQINLIRSYSGLPAFATLQEAVMGGGAPGASQLERYKQELEKAGMKVSGPLSMADIEKKMEEIQRKTRQEVQEQLRLDEKRNQMLITFGTETAGAILSALSGSAGSEKKNNVLSQLSKSVQNIGSQAANLNEPMEQNMPAQEQQTPEAQEVLVTTQG